MEDRCIICGSIIPEGRQVCPNCEAQSRLRRKSVKRQMTDSERTLLIMIALAAFFSFAASLLLNWP